jgi:hypothetical protein
LESLWLFELLELLESLSLFELELDLPDRDEVDRDLLAVLPALFEALFADLVADLLAILPFDAPAEDLRESVPELFVEPVPAGLLAEVPDGLLAEALEEALEEVPDGGLAAVPEEVPEAGSDGAEDDLAKDCGVASPPEVLAALSGEALLEPFAAEPAAPLEAPEESGELLAASPEALAALPDDALRSALPDGALCPALPESGVEL